MSKFIVLTTSDDQPVFVNLDNVVKMTPIDGGTLLMTLLTELSRVYVKESMIQIAFILEKTDETYQMANFVSTNDPEKKKRFKDYIEN